MAEDNKIKVLKIKNVKVQTPQGEKIVSMIPVTIDTSPEAPNITDTLCGSCCSYGRICTLLRDPRDPENPSRCLNDWCNDIGFEKNEEKKTVETTEFASMVPAEGSIEGLYPEDSDSFKQLMKENPLIKLTTLIDSTCPGFCSMYNKEHSNCTLGNDFCIFKDVLTKKTEIIFLNNNKNNKEEQKKD